MYVNIITISIKPNLAFSWRGLFTTGTCQRNLSLTTWQRRNSLQHNTMVDEDRGFENKGKSQQFCDNDTRLDFHSENFDPVLALRVSGVSVPVTAAPKYDNLGKYKTAVDREAKGEPAAPKKKDPVSTGEFQRRWLPHQYLMSFSGCKRSRCPMLHFILN
ncbi:unnamed protein product [Acanthoscelides obtectus]|uniref:Uncharacterized protein n=1 Tax=Acanthoscelides obtectus TaxID=200917 RepID=A0A9P0KVT8_ACAOB|nr:unnamed protein product [Acanthoscelides obtectus]CAK1633682.1 hypothetical protein AOBTE_LOCUS8317 [Acanthoscelides obtectus]